jgi:hypothetical protein
VEEKPAPNEITHLPGTVQSQATAAGPRNRVDPIVQSAEAVTRSAEIKSQQENATLVFGPWKRLTQWYRGRPKRESARFTDHLIGWSTLVMTIATVGIWRVAVSSNEDTKDLIQAAQKQAQAADSFSASAGRIDAKIGQAEEDFRTMADSSKVSIEATREAMQLEQRPWVTVAVALVQQAGRDVILVQTSNTGRTPALRTRLIAQPEYLPACPTAKEPLQFTHELPGEEETVITLQPGHIGVGRPIPVIPGTHPGWPLHVYGYLTFNDVFGRQHRTEFSVYYLDQMFVNCHDHNDVN